MKNLALQTGSTSQVELGQIMEKVLLAGDLSKMQPADRIQYYLKTCESLGMNFLTKPFDLITLNGKMVLYPNRSGTDQLRSIWNVETQIVDKGFDKDTGCYVVTARAKLPNGRSDEDMGIVYCAGLKGDALANAQLKAMTKAKRRVTLSIIGLGWIDESEVNSVKGAKLHKMDLETGAVIDVGPTQPDTGSKPVQTAQESEEQKSKRQQLYSQIMPLYQPYMKAFPDSIIGNLISDRYASGDPQVRELGQITVEQVENFYHFLKGRLEGKEMKSEIKPAQSNQIQTAGRPATKEQIAELFKYARAEGLDKSHLDSFIKTEFEKTSWPGISYNELLIVEDAIRAGKIKPTGRIHECGVAVIPESDYPWIKEKESQLI